MFSLKRDLKRYVSEGMMLEYQDYGDDKGKGDALSRTGLAYVAYGKTILLDGIKSCYREFVMINRKKHLFQSARCNNRYREDDVSRDQNIMALASLKLMTDQQTLRDIALKIPYRISRRFIMGPALWLWIRAICGKGRFYTLAYQIVEIIQFVPSALWNKFFRRIMGLHHEYSQDYYFAIDESKAFWHYDIEKKQWVFLEGKGHKVNNGHKLFNAHQRKRQTNKFYRFMLGLEYPEYALHLTAWMTYCTDDSWMKRFIEKLIIWLAEDDNLLFRLLARDKGVKYSQLENFIRPQKYRWSCRFNGTSYTYPSEGDDKILNCLDYDLAKAIFNIN